MYLRLLEVEGDSPPRTIPARHKDYFSLLFLTVSRFRDEGGQSPEFSLTEEVQKAGLYNPGPGPQGSEINIFLGLELYDGLSNIGIFRLRKEAGIAEVGVFQAVVHQLQPVDPGPHLGPDAEDMVKAGIQVVQKIAGSKFSGAVQGPLQLLQGLEDAGVTVAKDPAPPLRCRG
jgi:hypothetical protein